MSTDEEVFRAWTIVVPVKGTPNAKSRLGASGEQALAIALDTVEVALRVGSVVVVVPERHAWGFAALGARVVDDPGRGVNAAVLAGAAGAGSGPTAILLGDLPALTHVELDSALARASRVPLAVVADAPGSGSVLLTSLGALPHRPAFGQGSHALHVERGYVDLPCDPDSGLRCDVDTREDLARLGGRLGARTAAAFGASGAFGAGGAGEPSGVASPRLSTPGSGTIES